MSEENVELVRGAMSALAGQDAVAWFEGVDHDDLEQLIEAVYAPDVEITWLEGNPDQGTYRGRAEVPNAFSDWLDAWETFVFEPSGFVAAGEHVLVPNTQRGRGKTSGVELSMQTTMVVTVRDGQIASIHEFDEHADALEAASLSE